MSKCSPKRAGARTCSNACAYFGLLSLSLPPDTVLAAAPITPAVVETTAPVTSAAAPATEHADNKQTAAAANNTDIVRMMHTLNAGPIFRGNTSARKPAYKK